MILSSPKGHLITTTLKLSGLHCVSCSLNIDDALEDLPGVTEASTSYAKQVSVITHDPDKVSVDDLQQTIESLGYKVLG